MGTPTTPTKHKPLSDPDTSARLLALLEEGASNAEAARQMGVTEGAIRQFKQRRVEAGYGQVVIIKEMGTAAPRPIPRNAADRSTIVERVNRAATAAEAVLGKAMQDQNWSLALKATNAVVSHLWRMHELMVYNELATAITSGESELAEIDQIAGKGLIVVNPS